jgi:LacI family transcriptional regulator
MLSPSIDWLREWPGDGAFVLITDARDARLARSLPMPLVNLAGHLEVAEVPTVTVDHRLIGVRAAGHLLERRFRRFGYYGIHGKWYSLQRRLGFTETIQAAGGSCEVLEVRDLERQPGEWVDQQEELESWLLRLVPPVGVMASTDLRAGMLLDACQRLGLRVPEDVAVIGVDNDPVACEFSQPPLSSVSRNDHEVGYRAAQLLDRLIRGGERPGEPLRIEPDGVVARRSTEVLAIDDPEVAAVVDQMLVRLHENFGVEALLGHTGLSRRRLEQRFRHSLGRSPAAFLNEQRVEKAKKLLEADDGRSLTDIATACGFAELRRFRMVFQRMTGKSPAGYRAGLRVHAR